MGRVSHPGADIDRRLSLEGNRAKHQPDSVETKEKRTTKKLLGPSKSRGAGSTAVVGWGREREAWAGWLTSSKLMQALEHVDVFVRQRTKR